MTSSDYDSLSNKSTRGFQLLIPVLLVLMVFLVASRSPIDSDLWWHLRSGQVMIETGHPLITDVFSYTREGETWINHSWLGEIIIFSLYRLGGWTAISAWMGAMAVLTVVFLWRQTSGSIYVKAGFILFASVVCAPLWTPRPQFFSLVLLALLVWLINRWLTRGGYSIWFSVLLFILWSNLHGGFVTGTLYLLAYSVGLLIDALNDTGDTRKMLLKKLRLLLPVTVGGYLASALNPNGFRMWLIPFQTVGVRVLRQFIQEWSSPDFHSVESWPFALFIILMIFCLSRQREKTSLRLMFPAILFILMGLYARRNMAAAAITGIGVLIDAWNSMTVGNFFKRLVPIEWLEWIKRYRAAQKQFNVKQMKWINLFITGVLGLICFIKLFIVGYPGLMRVYVAKNFPVDAVSYIMKTPPICEGRIFNSYNWGGYLIWRDPRVKVYVDGRTDLFGDEILGEWMTIIQAGNEWQNLLEKWDVTRVIIEPNRPLASIISSKGWVERYRDTQAVVFDRKK